MAGECENCARRDFCAKTVGALFGFCNTDFLPKKEEEEG